MSANFPGSILYGSANVPIFGAYGRPLYSDRAEAGLLAYVVIDWDEDDVDICAYWTGHGGKVGWNWGTTSSADGYEQWWLTNDNTEGGPEKVAVRAESLAQGSTWRVHLNWFRGGPGSAEVTIVPKVGNPVTVTSAVASRGEAKAEADDPGVEVAFNADGTIQQVRTI